MTEVINKVGAARVEMNFHVHGRGHVLVLGEHDGLVPRDGRVWHGARSAPYRGPEFIDAPDGRASVSIVLDDIGFDAIAAARSVTFTP